MDYDFVEIGSSDYDTLIAESSDNARGITIDPIQYYLDRLPNKPNVTKLNVAISDCEGSVDCYYTPEEIIQKYVLPPWVRGCNSINNAHPLVCKILQDIQVTPSDVLKIATVPKISMKTLLEKYNIGSIQYLKIDTEGHDCTILENYIEALKEGITLPAKKILFECNYLSDKKRVDAVIDQLQNIGYILIKRDEHDSCLEYRG